MAAPPPPGLRAGQAEWIEVPRAEKRRGGKGPQARAGVTCPTPTSVEHADIHVRSYTLHSRERYVCSSGFKRKAGTSSLIECVHNKTTNAAHWTAPNLKCIRDPSLTRQRPVPPSTVETAGVTPQPESLSPSGKEPAAASPRSDITVTTETAAAPGSQLMPSEPPSSGTTQIGGRESSKGPPQTTAETLGLTPSASSETPGASPFGSREATVVISASVLLCAVCAASFLACYTRTSSHSKELKLLTLKWPQKLLLRREILLATGEGAEPDTRLWRGQTFQLPSVEMENMEVVPMTGRTSNGQDDTENCSHNL
ncbi:PREDICTED: interleukin-15 receptor subunit alpha [Galeopterus variegatus]|uniref:Interleukin-15 receptor subunit alpha n=1 Tax=Galeopterus variegatus TaxID=482537 RepID=A0ABM0QH03_GALVR|nr:PREDICTED: interleukin-15 receptor subunit alpha [Galeopterus variegatus]